MEQIEKLKKESKSNFVWTLIPFVVFCGSGWFLLFWAARDSSVPKGLLLIVSTMSALLSLCFLFFLYTVVRDWRFYSKMLKNPEMLEVQEFAKVCDLHSKLQGSIHDLNGVVRKIALEKERQKKEVAKKL